MEHYIKYLPSGAITEVCTAPVLPTGEGEGLWLVCDEGTDDTLHYVDVSGNEPLVREKTPLDTSHTTSGLMAAFVSLPPDVRVEVSGAVGETDGSKLELEFDAPGTYTIELYPPPQYTDETLEVTVG